MNNTHFELYIEDGDNGTKTIATYDTEQEAMATLEYWAKVYPETTISMDEWKDKTPIRQII